MYKRKTVTWLIYKKKKKMPIALKRHHLMSFVKAGKIRVRLSVEIGLKDGSLMRTL